MLVYTSNKTIIKNFYYLYNCYHLSSLLHIWLTETRDCPPDHFSCGVGKACIPNIWKCDGHEDCSSGLDEDRSVCKYLRMPLDLIYQNMSIVAEPRWL